MPMLRAIVRVHFKDMLCVCRAEPAFVISIIDARRRAMLMPGRRGRQR